MVSWRNWPVNSEVEPSDKTRTRHEQKHDTTRIRVRVVLGQSFRVRVVFVFKVHVSCCVHVVLGQSFRVRVVFVFKVHVSCCVGQRFSCSCRFRVQSSCLVSCSCRVGQRFSCSCRVRLKFHGGFVINIIQYLWWTSYCIIFVFAFVFPLNCCSTTIDLLYCH